MCGYSYNTNNPVFIYQIVNSIFFRLKIVFCHLSSAEIRVWEKLQVWDYFFKIFFSAAFVTVFQLPRRLNNAYRLNFLILEFITFITLPLCLGLNQLGSSPTHLMSSQKGGKTCSLGLDFFLWNVKQLCFFVFVCYRHYIFLEYISPQRD